MDVQCFLFEDGFGVVVEFIPRFHGSVDGTLDGDGIIHEFHDSLCAMTAVDAVSAMRGVNVPDRHDDGGR